MLPALRYGWIITQRDLLHWVRQPAGPLFTLLFSLMLLVVFALFFGGAIQLPGGGDYIAYLLPGLYAMTMTMGVETTMAAMAQDSKKGVTDRFRSMPIASASVALGRSGADMLTSVLQLTALLLGGLVIGWRITSDPLSALLAVVLLLWLRSALLWVGIFLGLTFRGEGATVAVQVLVWPVVFLSNAFVSPETMPTWLAALASWNPLSATATATRQLFGNPTGVSGGWLLDAAVPMAVLWPLVITAVFLPLSARAYRRLSR